MSTQPTFGRVFTFFDAKPTYLITLLIFEIGSLICATAPNSIALIIGRGVAGIGAAGMLCGNLVIFGRVVPLRRRPLGMSIMTSVYGIAGVLGPTIGGLMTDTPRLTWRFCFWINLREL
jgi:MFS family permease